MALQLHITRMRHRGDTLVAPRLTQGGAVDMRVKGAENRAAPRHVSAGQHTLNIVPMPNGHNSLAMGQSVLPRLHRRHATAETAVPAHRLEEARAAERSVEEVARTGLPLVVRAAENAGVLASLDLLAGHLPSEAGTERLLLLAPQTTLMLRPAVRAGGGWPGLHCEAESLSGLARAALAGVDGGDRVEIVVHLERTVAGRAVEPLLAALAELADNALRASDNAQVVMVAGPPAGGVLPVTATDTGTDMDAAVLAPTQTLLRHRRGVYTASPRLPGRRPGAAAGRGRRGQRRSGRHGRLGPRPGHHRTAPGPRPSADRPRRVRGPAPPRSKDHAVINTMTLHRASGPTARPPRLHTARPRCGPGQAGGRGRLRSALTPSAMNGVR
ncbi:hypothetical protein [Kitasatospora sp. NPDC058046]|uniref:hypothetical protein n=1 Tax=Kitasatospora sp. NPDC058046 TaxID=3346312 RepID=UPI0036D86490